jgi:predicted secreted protein
VIPLSSAVGRLPVRSDPVQHLGPGRSNYVLDVQPVDTDSLAGHQYDIGFRYQVKRVVGDLSTELELYVTDSSTTVPYNFGIEFVSSTQFLVKNLTTGVTIGREIKYMPDVVYKKKIGYGLNFMLTEPAEAIAPENGDQLVINFTVDVVTDQVDTLIQGRTFAFNRPYAADDGFIFTLYESEDTLDITLPPLTGFELEFEVDDSGQLLDTSYTIMITETGLNVSNAPFISLDIMYDSAGVFIVRSTEDSLFISDMFAFDGIEGTVEELSGDNLPPEGTVVGLRAVPSVMPNLQDAYRVGLLPEEVDREQIEEEIKKVRVVPNPYMVASLWEQEFGELRREPIRQIQFINLPPICKIHIFTIAGDRLKTIEHDGSHGTETWDLRAESGREIAAGIYLYLVKTDDSEYLDRFAVIK